MRPALKRFAELMEKVLVANDHKGGWDKCTLDFLGNKLKEEFDEVWKLLKAAELENAFQQFEDEPAKMPIKFRKAMARELADVANVCMMIYDRMVTPKTDQEPEVVDAEMLS